METKRNSNLTELFSSCSLQRRKLKWPHSGEMISMSWNTTAVFEKLKKRGIDFAFVKYIDTNDKVPYTERMILFRNT